MQIAHVGLLSGHPGPDAPMRRSPPSVNIRESMLKPWTEQLPGLQGHLTTLREVATSDVYTLFTLFADPAITAFMAPPPPTLAKFAGFVEWSHQQREQGRGLCFGIVPEGMTAAVGILQVRSLDSGLPRAEWGFVLSAHFWATGLFFDAANAAADFAFTTLHVDCLEARIASRNRRAHAAVQKLGARAEAIIESMSQTGVPRDPEMVWALREAEWRSRLQDPRASLDDARERIRKAVDAAESEVQRSQSPEAAEPYPLFLFDRRRRE